MDGTVKGNAAFAAIAAPAAGLIAEAEAAARNSYEQWEQEMYASRGDAAYELSSDVERWWDEWLTTGGIDVTEAQADVMRESFCREAELRLESYDGPTRRYPNFDV